MFSFARLDPWCCSLLVLGALVPGCDVAVDIGTRIDPRDPRTPAALDVLFVVDNSGSMREEQAALAQSAMKADCPVTDLLNVPPEYQDPDPQTRADLERRCGFAQLLAAAGRDFRIGVITTTVDECDNKFGQAPDRGFHPQRGCLQPAASGSRIFGRDDPTLGATFASALEGLGTYGSGFERGLDALWMFVAPRPGFDGSCPDDATSLLRPGADLLVVFVTDEDDCSHALGTTTFAEETTPGCGVVDFDGERHNAARCYDTDADLSPPSQYAALLHGLVDDGAVHGVSVGIIAGVSDGTNRTAGESCVLDSAGARDTACRPAFGQSIDPTECPADASPACCTADPSFRYARFAQEFDEQSVVSSSICRTELTAPMLAIVAQLPAVGSSR